MTEHGGDTTATLRYDGKEYDATHALNAQRGRGTMARSQPRLVDAPLELKPPTKTIAKGLGSGSTGLAGVDEFADLIADWIEYETMANATQEEIEKISSFVDGIRFHAAGLHRVFAEVHRHEAARADDGEPR